ncbi:MAG: hypothetical protein PHX30_02205 [Candidatus Pacebacteria bacterium]|nr:hypothetical protein [Candidatus Paceibacterota bacterium]
MGIIDFLRQYHIGNYAVFDLALAFLGMCLLAPFLSKGFKKLGLVVPEKNWIFLTLPISVFAHLAVGRMTAMTRDFVDPDGYYFLKIMILILFILGTRGIKKV